MVSHGVENDEDAAIFSPDELSFLEIVTLDPCILLE